ncbi:MAG: molybdenum cofactor biosynthesis protein MoaE [Planctomycetota bacterium]
MQLRIRLFAGLRERAGADELTVDGLPDELDVAGLKRLLEERHPELGTLGHVRGVVGTSYVPDGTVLAEGDEVALLPPVSGGAPEDEALERGIFELSSEALDAAGCQRRVEHPSCGAVVCFTGLTRDRNRGQDVDRLDYEAFGEMAGAEMARIFAACRARFGPDRPDRAEGFEPADYRLRMLTQHRTGTVRVGEPSVIIAVASPHRDAAFGAARFLIDELKASVPLWKKECYAAGHHWIGDRS